MSGAGLEPARSGRPWSRFSFCSVVSASHSSSPEGPEGMEPVFWMVHLPRFQPRGSLSPLLKALLEGFSVNPKLGVQMW